MMDHDPLAPPPAPPFSRLLARVTTLSPSPAGERLLDYLAQWLDWTRAVALSRVLDAPLALPLRDDDHGAGVGSDALIQTQQQLRDAIDDDASWRALATQTGDTAEQAYAPLRQHYVALQRKLQAASGRLRGQLRDQLSQAEPQRARLAALDAHMDALLSPREHSLLGAIPELLGQRYAQLHAQAPASPAESWQHSFRTDMRCVLLAELELRFLPLHALQAALRP